MAIDPYMEHRKILKKLLADSFITMLYNTAILDYVYDNFEELSQIFTAYFCTIKKCEIRKKLIYIKY